MNKIFFVFFLMLISFNSLTAQKEYEFLGFLTVNDTALISYRLNLRLTGSDISGYSVTSIGGPHETKSYIKGKYNAKGNMLSFKEYGVEYTKSDVDTYDFCFVNFKGKLNKIGKETTISGDFLGKYNDDVACINGTLNVKSIEKILKKAERTQKKINRIKKIPDSIKNKINLTKIIDEQRLNVLKANQNTTIFLKKDTFELHVWDAGKIDGDKITVTYNNKIILKNHAVTKNKKTLILKLDGSKNRLVIKAENIGEIAPNTAKILIKDGKRTIDLLSNLKAKEETVLQLIGS